MLNHHISVIFCSEKQKAAATDFAQQYGYRLSNETDTSATFSLLYTDKHIKLMDNNKNMSIFIDFLSADFSHRRLYGGGRGQSIAKAIGLKQGTPPPTVIDATAGLAKDAYVLACLGCAVTLIERSPIISVLLKDAIKRADENEHFQSIMKKGFTLINQSSIEYLTGLKNKEDEQNSCPEVIYLDPMYPDKKKSASVKKNMQILQELLGKDEDTQELLNISLKVATKRVVVKRPKGAKNLTNQKPTYNVESKKTRYDVYIIQST